MGGVAPHLGQDQTTEFGLRVLGFYAICGSITPIFCQALVTEPGLLQLAYLGRKTNRFPSFAHKHNPHASPAILFDGKMILPDLRRYSQVPCKIGVDIVFENAALCFLDFGNSQPNNDY